MGQVETIHWKASCLCTRELIAQSEKFQVPSKSFKSAIALKVWAQAYQRLKTWPIIYLWAAATSDCAKNPLASGQTFHKKAAIYLELCVARCPVKYLLKTLKTCRMAWSILGLLQGHGAACIFKKLLDYLMESRRLPQVPARMEG